MNMLPVLALMGGMGSGYMEQQRRNKEDARQATMDKIVQDRAAREQDQYDQEKKVRTGLANAGAQQQVTDGATVSGIAAQPTVYDDTGVANSDQRQSRVMASMSGSPAPQVGVTPSPTFNGMTYATRDAASADAAKYNTPDATRGRQLAFMRTVDPMRADQMEATGLHLQNQRMELRAKQWDSDVQTEAAKGPEALMQWLSESGASPVKSKAVQSADGKTFSVQQVMPDGTTKPMGGMFGKPFENSPAGAMEVAMLLSKSVPVQAKVQHYQHEAQIKQTAEHQAAVLKQQAEEGAANRKNAMQIAGSHNAMTLQAAQIRANTAAGLTADGKPQPGSEDGSIGTFSKDAIEAAASRYRMDRTLPPNLGRGTQKDRVVGAIVSRAAEQAKAAGETAEEQALRGVAAKANSMALGQLTKQKTMVGAFEKNFVKNADIVLELSDKVGRSGVPLLNRWINAGKRSIAGDPEIAQLDTAVKAVSNEYAKIVSGSTGSAAVAEGEIKKIEGLLNSAQTPKQIKAVLDTMRRETQNRMKGFDDQEKELRDSMTPPKAESKSKILAAKNGRRSSSQTEAPADTNDKGWTLHKDANGNMAYVSPDGQQFEEVK